MRIRLSMKLKNGKQFRCKTTRQALQKYFEAKGTEIDWLTADINVNTWLYNQHDGWAQCPKIEYSRDGLKRRDELDIKGMKIHGFNGRTPWSHLR